VSAITPVRNAVRTIGASIKSALAKALVAKMFVVDEHANDQSMKIAREVSDPRFLIFHSSERGIAAAFKCGLSHLRIIGTSYRCSKIAGRSLTSALG
jgi:glycosyltransferase involved in cell wall biosynthesis